MLEWLVEMNYNTTVDGAVAAAHTPGRDGHMYVTQMHG